MNANAFRHFFGYHFAENRNLWDSYIEGLTDEQFSQSVNYAHGSVRNQIVHLISVDDTWFSGLRGVELPEPLNPADFPDREGIRAHWDRVEQTMRDYLTSLRDGMLSEQPLEDDDKGLILWQVLLHVVNHGTDHRAQILRLLNDLGVKTVSQDYIFYVYDNLTETEF
ncbi:MAG: DinB family protein [Caldilineaceae bacterium]|nr:DinB family protein [Caldilineaceae bacterium]